MGDHVFLKVSPMKNVMRFGKKGKLSPRYVGPFEVLEKVGALAYRVVLLLKLENFHNVFHVSSLRKYVYDASHVVEIEPIQLDENLAYEEYHIRTVDTMNKVLRRTIVKLIKVQWSNHEEREATWELECNLKEKHPNLFYNLGMLSLDDLTSFKEGMMKYP